GGEEVGGVREPAEATSGAHAAVPARPDEQEGVGAAHCRAATRHRQLRDAERPPAQPGLLARGGSRAARAVEEVPGGVMRFGLFLLFEWPGPERDFPTMYEEVLEQIQNAEALGLEVVEPGQ